MQTLRRRDSSVRPRIRPRPTGGSRCDRADRRSSTADRLFGWTSSYRDAIGGGGLDDNDGDPRSCAATEVAGSASWTLRMRDARGGWVQFRLRRANWTARPRRISGGLDPEASGAAPACSAGAIWVTRFARRQLTAEDRVEMDRRPNPTTTLAVPARTPRRRRRGRGTVLRGPARLGRVRGRAGTAAVTFAVSDPSDRSARRSSCVHPVPGSGPARSPARAGPCASPAAPGISSANKPTATSCCSAR